MTCGQLSVDVVFALTYDSAKHTPGDGCEMMASHFISGVLWRPGVVALCALAMASPVTAQSATDARLSLDLNRVDQLDGTCRFTFLAENQLGQDIPAFTVETVVIDAEGVVDRLTLFEFGALPDGVPRVRQFDVPDLACDAVGRILVNGIADCGGVQNCADGLSLTSRTAIDVLG